MASNTQQLCHLTLRYWDDKFQLDDPEDPLIPRIVRACLMFSQFVMLFCTTTIQSHRNWWDSINCPVRDFVYNLNPGGIPMRWMLANYFMLLWSYGAAIIPLFQWTKNTFKVIQGLVVLMTPYVIMPVGIHLAKFLDSMEFDLLLSGAWFGVGVWALKDDRRWGKEYFNNCSDASEDAWSFGQILPIILLLVPMMTALDGFARIKPPPAPIRFLLKNYMATTR